MSTLKGRSPIIINISRRLLIKKQRNINYHFKTLFSLKKTIEARGEKHISISLLLMSVSITLTSKCFIALSIFHQILQQQKFYFVRDLLAMALHYKQNRTHLKNKIRHYSEVTGSFVGNSKSLPYYCSLLICWV